MRHLVRLARIGRDDDRQPPFRRRGARERDPAEHPCDDGSDPCGIGAMFAAGELQVGIERRVVLEARDAREQAAVDFGQHDMHRQINRRQPALRACPGRAIRCGERNLEHRHARPIERRGSGVIAR